MAPKGARGDRGRFGSEGKPGPAGEEGRPGRDGIPGIRGPMGRPGLGGEDGQFGLKGQVSNRSTIQLDIVWQIKFPPRILAFVLEKICFTY